MGLVIFDASSLIHEAVCVPGHHDLTIQGGQTEGRNKPRGRDHEGSASHMLATKKKGLPRFRERPCFIWCRHQESNSGPPDYKSLVWVICSDLCTQQINSYKEIAVYGFPAINNAWYLGGTSEGKVCYAS